MVELFRIMPGRYNALQDTVAGYQHTGIPLVTYTQTNGVGPVSNADGDDWGAYYIIPKMVDTFGLSLDATIQLLYSGTVVLAFVAGVIGSWLYCKTRIGKFVSVLALAMLAVIVAGVGDIYIFLGATTMALVPWWLYVQERCGIKGQLIFCIVAGLFLGAAHLMRNHSGTAALIFIILSMILKKQLTKKLVLALSTVLMMGLFILWLGFKGFVVQTSTNYLAEMGHANDSIFHHLFWHNVYFSLGYLSNPHGIELSDTYSVKKARSLDPEVTPFSTAYEELLKEETFRVVTKHPFFVINTVAAKFGVCLMYVFIFANIGLLLAVYYRKGYAFDLPFVAAIGFNMLFGLLVTPDYQFLLGLFSFSAIYGIYSIDFAVSQRSALNTRAA